MIDIWSEGNEFCLMWESCKTISKYSFQAMREILTINAFISFRLLLYGHIIGIVFYFVCFAYYCDILHISN